MILIVEDEPQHRHAAKKILVDAGWNVTAVQSGAEAFATLAAKTSPTLVLLNPDLHGSDGDDLVSAIRAADGPAASAPIVAYVAEDRINGVRPHACGFDDVLPKPCTSEALLGIVARWEPDGAASSLDRLEANFGTEQIQSMVARFGALIAEASAALDHGDAQPIAHRVAGVAGILGFTAAGKAWLAISEGDDTAEPEARRESRRVLAALAQR